MLQAPIGRVYRMSWGFRIFAALFLAVSTAITTEKVLKVFFESQEPNFGFAVLFIFPIVGAGMTAKAFSSTIRFTESSIERRSVFGMKSVSLAMIRGRREYTVQGDEGGATRYLRLVANDGSNLDFGKSHYAFDDAFRRWFSGLPDLDSNEKNHGGDHDNPTSKFGLV